MDNLGLYIKLNSIALGSGPKYNHDWNMIYIYNRGEKTVINKIIRNSTK